MTATCHVLGAWAGLTGTNPLQDVTGTCRSQTGTHSSRQRHAGATCPGLVAVLWDFLGSARGSFGVRGRGTRSSLSESQNEHDTWEHPCRRGRETTRLSPHGRVHTKGPRRRLHPVGSASHSSIFSQSFISKLKC